MPTSDDYICLQCSRVNPTCCRLSPGMEKFCFPLSGSDKTLISSYLQSDHFSVDEKNNPDFISRMTRLIPLSRKEVYQVFALDNFHSRLKTNTEGSCVLLGKDGCVLPAEIRPAYCRLYPFWFQHQKLTYIKDRLCLAQDREKSVQGLVRLFGVSPEKLQKTFNTLLDDLTSK